VAAPVQTEDDPEITGVAGGPPIFTKRVALADEPQVPVAITEITPELPLIALIVLVDEEPDHPFGRLHE
jgi:hypothetical protein